MDPLSNVEAAFSRAFKRETGLSPAAWRRARQGLTISTDADTFQIASQDAPRPRKGPSPPVLERSLSS
jgi:hypothetical protein